MPTMTIQDIILFVNKRKKPIFALELNVTKLVVIEKKSIYFSALQMKAFPFQDLLFYIFTILFCKLFFSL